MSTNESMRRRRHTTPVARALHRFFSSRTGADNLSLARLWDQWDSLFGKDITDMISPLGHSKDTLLLGAEDAIVIQEFSYFSDQILEKVNGFLGEPVFSHIHIELLRGRTPLDQRLLGTIEAAPPPSSPEDLGKPGTLPDNGSPVARAYKAYVAYFKTKTAHGTTGTDTKDNQNQ
ncbi:DciA family protein [Desulfoplanes sp.]